MKIKDIVLFSSIITLTTVVSYKIYKNNLKLVEDNEKLDNTEKSYTYKRHYTKIN